MLKEIIFDGEVLTADHWLKAGLPPCLHDCLDGSPWLYQEDSRTFFDEKSNRSSRWAIEKIFRFPKIEEGLVPLKLAYFEYRERKKEEYLPLGKHSFLPGGEFLYILVWNINEAVWTLPIIKMTQKQIDENRDAAVQAVRTIRRSPLVDDNDDPDSLLVLVSSLLVRKFRHEGRTEDVSRASDILEELRMHLATTGIGLSFGEYLDHWVECLPKKQDRGLSRPGRGEAEKRYFCISLIDNFSWLMGKSIYREVAILATAVFSDTSEDYVRKAHQRAQT